LWPKYGAPAVCIVSFLSALIQAKRKGCQCGAEKPNACGASMIGESTC
jgi:hypothetical protein